MTFPSYVQPGTSLRSASICARVRAGVPAGSGRHFFAASVDMFVLGLKSLQPRDAQHRRRVRIVESRMQGVRRQRRRVVLIELDQGARKVAGVGNSCRVGVRFEFVQARIPTCERLQQKVNTGTTMKNSTSAIAVLRERAPSAA